jgi:hypothetical protein
VEQDTITSLEAAPGFLLISDNRLYSSFPQFTDYQIGGVTGVGFTGATGNFLLGYDSLGGEYFLLLQRDKMSSTGNFLLGYDSLGGEYFLSTSETIS